MPQTNALAGHSSNLAYFAIKEEVTSGSFTAPAASDIDPATDGNPTVNGGSIEMDAILGNRYKNLTVPTVPYEIGGAANGPFQNGAKALVAAMAGTIHEETTYSIDLGVGKTDSLHALGAIIDTYTIRGSLGSVVTYALTWKCKSIVVGTALTPVTPTVHAVGCVGVTLTSGLASGEGVGFEIGIANNAKSQGKYGSLAPAYIFSGGYGVTGKGTFILTGPPFVPGVVTRDTGACSVALTPDDGGALATYTMATCYITRVGQTVRVGNVTMQDVEWVASAESGAVPLAIT